MSVSYARTPSRYLAKAKAGQTVEVTERGTLITLLVPPEAPASARDALVASGRLRPATAAFRLPRRVTAAAGSPGTGSILDDLRGDR